jgi:histidinol-phosphate aminotransferase
MATKRTRFSHQIESLPATVPFVAPEALERITGRAIELRLGANESPFGVSPKAIAAIQQEVTKGYLYGDPESLPLRQALAAKHHISIDEMAVGSGIDEILGWIARSFLDPGDAVVTSLGGYPTFNYHVTGFGGRLHFVPYTKEWTNHLTGLAQAAHDTHARLVYLANPDNPTGTFYSADTLSTFITSLPEETTLVLDEAYIEFADPAQVLPLSPVFDRVIRLRTFSKAYGMAGLRIGYAVANKDIIKSFDKFRNHFGVNRIAQAGALAALSDTDFLSMVTAQTRIGRRDLAMAASQRGLTPIPSSTNFLLIHVGDEHRAKQIVDSLMKDHGVFIRMPGTSPLNECIRVTIGTPEQHPKLLQALEQVW